MTWVCQKICPISNQAERKEESNSNAEDKESDEVSFFLL